uniref:Uncharacterized protein n=1 Tax=Anguilla anguilla TaxID=7936 RepID=A0A0E9Y038_ANGAN
MSMYATEEVFPRFCVTSQCSRPQRLKDHP